MPVRLTLRSNRDFSPFREMLLWLIEAPTGDSILLCSGYIWEPTSGYKILDDELLDSFKRGCRSGKLITVAGKLEQEMWRDFYRNFVYRIKASGLSVTSYVAERHNWHAKIAMRLQDNVPVAAIIGSSNLTGPAYRMDWRNWNFEGDVLIWGSNPALDGYFKRSFSTQAVNAATSYGDVHLILDPQVRQPTEEEQMQALFKDVMHSELKDFVE